MLVFQGVVIPFQRVLLCFMKGTYSNSRVSPGVSKMSCDSDSLKESFYSPVISEEQVVVCYASFFHTVQLITRNHIYIYMSC